jgi:hypothetical protein
VVNDKAAASFHGSPPVLYLVVCGRTHVLLDELTNEALAVDVALAHDQVHHCSPWVQYPLEHIHQEDS